jgi:predicted dehydrogenase
MTAASYSRVLGANDRVNLGVVGCGGRGKYVMGLFQKDASVHVSAVCDVYGQRIDEAKAKAPDAAAFQDHRKLIEQKTVDVVLVATPDHWHAPIAIDVMNAGKDVYVEKPLMYRREEGPQVVRAARLNNRICQVGLQQRSGPQYIQVRDELIRTKKIGKVTAIRSWWHGRTPRKFVPPVVEKPSNLDWTRWLGQVRWREWDPIAFFHYRSFLDFGGGKITDLFTHWVDAAHMMMDDDQAISVNASGGVYFPFNDRVDSPDTLHILSEYRKNWMFTFESYGLDGMPPDDIEICGTEGRVLINRRRFEYRTPEKGAQPKITTVPREITIDHVQNFLDCCRTRKLPNCDPWFGYKSTQIALLALESYKSKRRVRFDPEHEDIVA